MTHIDQPDGPEDRFESLEYTLFQRSPLGSIGTSLVIFGLIYGLYILIAQLTQSPPFIYLNADGVWVSHQVSWIAFVLSLLLTTAIAFEGSGKDRWEPEIDALVVALPEPGADTARNLAKGIPIAWRARYHRLFWIGFIFGIVFNLWLMYSDGQTLMGYLDSVGLWFLIISPPLFGTGFRAGMDVSRRSREIKALVADHLVIDLFHLDRLTVFGRIGIRAARSWLLMSAILLLFMLSPDQLWIAIPTILATAVGGVFILTSTLNPVHRKICAAKSAELERIHEEMALVRGRAMAGDDSASAALAGLTDYEIWVTNRSEWPLSGGLATRFSLYILLPVLPIVASYIFEKVADQLVTGGPV